MFVFARNGAKVEGQATTTDVVSDIIHFITALHHAIMVAHLQQCPSQVHASGWQAAAGL
jgi:hypothetical protein